MNILGDRLKQLRKSRGLNQTQLSEALNEQFGLKTDRVMISKWETGFQTPMINTIICIAKFFNVSIDYLNGNEQSNTMKTLSFDRKVLSEEEGFMLELFNKVPEDKQQMVIEMIRAALKSGE